MVLGGKGTWLHVADPVSGENERWEEKKVCGNDHNFKDAIAAHVDYRPNVADTANRKAA